MLGHLKQPLPIAVVIATHDRFHMLSKRAIPSVIQQTYRSEFFVVVDDSSSNKNRSRNKEFIESTSTPDNKIIYIENKRTKGASGSWNTAIDFLCDTIENPEYFFIAILDDDDSWEPTYLEECYTMACERKLDIVATDLYRIENVGGTKLITKAPNTLFADDFLTKNPGIQGSNLFLRMNLFLYAGGFDEELRSTTDRDICIRITDLGAIHYGRLPSPLVNHFAEADRIRLSTRGSETKLDGLTAFWRKYVGRMSKEQQRAFSKRALNLFNWQPPRSLASEDSLHATKVEIGSYQPQNHNLDAHGERSSKIAEQERVKNIKNELERRFSLEDLQYLGCGEESVVFTDKRIVYKCIDNWKTHGTSSTLEFLKSQTGRWLKLPGLYTIHQVIEDDFCIILTYDYEASTPYKGEYEEEILQLLESCYRAKIVCNNIHPKNLIVTSSGVQLIDYGADIQPLSALGFEHMARRAFLACRYASHPHLRQLMKRALVDTRISELLGYSLFREKLSERLKDTIENTKTWEENPTAHEPFALYVGIISSDPQMLRPLLDELALLCLSPSLRKVGVLVLDNGSPKDEMQEVLGNARKAGLPVAMVSESQQRQDARAGAFGTQICERCGGQVGIAQARTMLQRYLGTLLRTEEGSIGWLLDDDMRVDDRAFAYLRWLPTFRQDGVDVLLGRSEGSSPNPPLNGLRVNMVDLLHNLIWLQRLPPDALLPDRTAENAELRARYPDYYYDLSRKHTGHLEMPNWLEPIVKGETVREALLRFISGARGVLYGRTMTRPVILKIPYNPQKSAKDSLNRGGCTFILNHRALTFTPNVTLRLRDREARRSDMFWAIINRYYRQMTIKTVDFPVQHLSRAYTNPDVSIEKVQGELIGSSLYAGLTEFLTARPQHQLHFSMEEVNEIQSLVESYQKRRMRSLKQSLYRIEGLRRALKHAANFTEIDELLRYLERWYTQDSFQQIFSGVHTLSRDDIQQFVTSLRSSAEDYASADVEINFIHDQLDGFVGGA